MMKTLKTRRVGGLAMGIALAGFFAVTAAATAQYPNENRDPNENRNRRRAMVQQSYDRMRQYARELDDLAREANRQAQAQQFGYRGFRRDSNFLREINRFAQRAREFRTRMDTYQTSPWNVDDEIAKLMSDARSVETRIRRARFVDRRTVANWNQAVSLLNQMASEYQAGIGGRWRGNRGDGRDRGDAYPNGAPPPGTYREPNPNEPPPPPPPNYRQGQGDWRQGQGNSRPGQGDLRQLAAELDQRAARASQLAGGYSGFSPEIRRFSDSARNFHAMVEENRMTGPQLRTEVNRLLQDAQSAHEELTRRPGTVSQEVAGEWDAIVQTLTRMRDSI
jgi:chromosome segregation ATPase